MYVDTNGKLVEDSTVDLALENHGSVVLIDPRSDAGKAWLDANVGADPWQFVGRKIAAEPRLVEAVAAGAEADGLVVAIS